jgi:hypothetical protein
MTAKNTDNFFWSIPESGTGIKVKNMKFNDNTAVCMLAVSFNMAQSCLQKLEM